MKTAIIIPARYGSERLPGKPLLRTTGKYLIQHVWEKACQARNADRVLVATDDERIVTAVQSFGGEVVLTRSDHSSGTDRVAEAARALDVDVVVNLQGDEPLIDPAAIDKLPELLQNDPSADLATLAVPFHTLAQWNNPNCVKVVCDQRGKALYFSRSPIPHVRGDQPDFNAKPPQVLQHLGLYAYRRPVLFRLAASKPDPLEKLEKLEQLRALALGYRIYVGLIPSASIGVDTLDDYEKFVQTYRRMQTSQAA